MNHERMKELFEKYPFAYFRQTYTTPNSYKGWITLPDDDTDFFDNCEYRLYPVIDRFSSEPTEEMIERGAVFLGKIAIYGDEVKMPEGVDSFIGWRHFRNRSYSGWGFSDKLSGKFVNDTLVYCIDPSDPNAEEIIKMNALKRKFAKPCPFCGLKLDIFDPDFSYPVGRHGDIFRAGCMESAGGCTAEVLGKGRYNAIDNWNKRILY
jgi:hypothetical protein